ncbi:type III-B CRISPR-associated protein Cas10/Cmr2 [Desulfobulbus elongatus]|uniref:type III-B CRISPR-associated protein Cas10/Cmr2 n=1 Tax=Desulfobulbus elongatus TaxID=53332 RepID=UPI000483D541|nr:type III-B CRISPR-associated protein Cas10/Cmr2 [Desulfobulbus elongatus]
MTHDNYWQHKLSLWLHDPVHKIFDIRRHESLAADLAELLHVTTPSKDTYQNADMIAAGLTRAALPGFNTDSAQNGAIDFSADPVVTHPLVKGRALRLGMPPVKVDAIHAALRELLKSDLGLDKTIEQLRAIPEEERPLSGYFDRHDTPEQWARALYFYFFFALKKRLRQKDVGGLGGAWDLLPADSRMPDHPLWHHLGMTSAIGSSLAADPAKELSLAVFAITPVQPFISRARKLRDHWVGSVILSYLAFAGIRHVADTLGPDHILYPSLHDQTLVESWIGKAFHLERFLEEQDEALQQHRKNGAAIASFPNKFVFLCPTSQVGDICRRLEEAIQQEWLRQARLVKGHLVKQHGGGATLAELFEHQIADYWQFNHAASRLAGLDDREPLASLLHQEKWQDEYQTIAAFAKPYGQTGATLARLYGTSHTLVQSVLAAAKLKPTRIRRPQQGEKCPLCGEHEVLHDFSQAGSTKAVEYKNAVKDFWDGVRGKENSGDSFAQIGKSERLCAVCAVKRFLPQVLKNIENKTELLAEVLTDAKKFPATTAMAADRYIHALLEKQVITEDEKEQVVQSLHESELEEQDANDDTPTPIRSFKKKGEEHGIRFTDRDKYYALLLMDGDKMGDLINGKTLTATWGDVLHPDLKARFEQATFHPHSALRPRMDNIRLLNPALHAAVSDGLNSFARYGVAPVVHRLGGRLIYAGGDDVCAILPLDAALEAADAIRQAYTMGFVRYTADGAVEVRGECPAGAGKLGMHLGQAEKISISAAVVIAHHKAPLREVLRDAHAVLDGIAKKRAGRNALAVRLKKRSGGDRDLWMQWDEENSYFASNGTPPGTEPLLSSFKEVMRGVTDDLMGGSLLYRLGDLEQALAPLVVSEATRAANRDKVVSLIAYEVGHSGKKLKDDEKNLFARRLAGLMVRGTSNQPGWYNPEAAIIAHFLALPAARRNA